VRSRRRKRNILVRMIHHKTKRTKPKVMRKRETRRLISTGLTQKLRIRKFYEGGPPSVTWKENGRKEHRAELIAKLPRTHGSGCEPFSRQTGLMTYARVLLTHYPKTPNPSANPGPNPLLLPYHYHG